MAVRVLAFITTIAISATAYAEAPCGIRFMPLAVGTSWTYTPADSPEQLEIDSKPAHESAVLKTQQPKQAEKIVIKVDEIANDGNETIIKLTETIDSQEIKTELRCTKRSLTVPMHSIFWAGEPGSGFGYKLTDVDKKGTSYPLRNGRIAGRAWKQTVTAKVTRETSVPDLKLPEAALTINKSVSVKGKESLDLNVGRVKATKLEVSMDGESKVEPYDSMTLRADATNKLWFSDKFGLVQIHNSFGHLFQLSSFVAVK